LTILSVCESVCRFSGVSVGGGNVLVYVFKVFPTAMTTCLSSTLLDYIFQLVLLLSSKVSLAVFSHKIIIRYNFFVFLSCSFLFIKELLCQLEILQKHVHYYVFYCIYCNLKLCLFFLGNNTQRCLFLKEPSH
jgi:hypothetical protein